MIHNTNTPKIKETPTEKYLREILELLRLNASQPTIPTYISCPPHSFIPYTYEGAWGASTLPPNMRCTKCLTTQRF